MMPDDTDDKQGRRCGTCAWLDRETVHTLCGREYGRCVFGPLRTWLRFARVKRVALDGGEDCPAWREIWF